MKLLKSLTGISCLIFIFLCVVSTTKAASLADSLFARGSYQDAALEYEYEYYKTEDLGAKSLYLIRKAECYSLMQSFKLAVETLDRIDIFPLTDSLKKDVNVRLAYASYLSENYAKAESHLLQYEALCSDSIQIIPILPVYALVSNELYNWNDAKQKLEAYVRYSYTGSVKDSIMHAVRTLYDASNIPVLKNLKKAQRMSTFLPGLGQMYAGYFGEGIISSALVLASVGFTVYSIITAHYVTAAVVGYGLMGKFYQGGIRHLVYLVGKTNYKRSKKFNDAARIHILAITGK